MSEKIDNLIDALNSAMSLAESINDDDLSSSIQGGEIGFAVIVHGDEGYPCKLQRHNECGGGILDHDGSHYSLYGDELFGELTVFPTAEKARAAIRRSVKFWNKQNMTDRYSERDYWIVPLRGANVSPKNRL